MTPRFQKLEAIVVLGAQIIRREDLSIGLALHTEMRARAAGFAYKLGVASMLIVSGGHNVGVRYSLKDNKILPEPSFNPFARIKARLYPSEARVMAGFLHENYGIPWNAMILEEESVDTQQNAAYCSRIIRRLGINEIGLLTSLYHLKQATASFKKIGLDVKPLCAEDLLALEDRTWIDRIVEYYSDLRGGEQWNAEQIRSRLQRGESTAAGLI